MIEKINLTPVRRMYEAYKNEIGTAETPSVSFTDLLKESLEKLNQSQMDASAAINSFLKGESTDIHKVMIASQKASLNMSLAIQLRHKVIEAYREIMRMQV